MGRAAAAFSNFTAGELSPRLDGRTDLKKYFNGCKELTNMIVHPHGSAARRPGTKFAMDAKFIDEPCRLIPFEFNTEQAYILELGENYMRFYKDNAIIVKTSSTSITNITKANPGVVTSNSHGLSNGDYIILGSVTGMSQINNIQFKVAGVTTNTFQLKTTDDDNFDTTNFDTYTSGGSVFEIYEISTPYSASQLDQIKFAQSADVMYLTHPSHPIQKLSRTGHTSWTLATVSITGSPSPALNTASNNYPAVVSFFEQRLVFANTNLNPQTLWFSKSNEYENFTTGTNADDAMIFTIASNQVNSIRYLSASRSLIVGTVGGEFLVTGSDTVDGLSPTNINIRRQATYGSADVSAVPVGNVTLFLQRAKRKIRELVYNYDSDNYVAPDLTILAEHVTDSTIKEMAYQQEPHSILWTVREDGILAGMTYQRNENVVAWHKHIFGGRSRTGKTTTVQSKSFTANATNVNTTNNTITITGHGFNVAVPVSYFAASNKIDGLEHDRFYFVNVVDANTIKLSNTVDGAIAGTDIVSLRSAPATDTTQSITQGVNLVNGVFYSGGHGFGNGDFVFLECPDNLVIGGLNKTDKFFVDPIDNNLFKLATDIDLDNYVTLSNAPTSFVNYSWLTHAKVESVAVIPGEGAEDVLYVVVNRQINGENKRYIEYLTSYDYGNVQADGHFVDSGLTYSGNTTSTVSGLFHLEGEKIDATTDGSAHPQVTVTNGKVTLQNAAQKIKLGFNYESVLQTMRVELQAEDGTAQGKIKRIHDVTVRLFESLGVEIGGSLDNMERIPFRDSSMPMTQSVKLFTGDKDAEFRGDYDKEGYVYVRQNLPLPLTVLAIYPRLNIFDG